MIGYGLLLIAGAILFPLTLTWLGVGIETLDAILAAGFGALGAAGIVVGVSRIAKGEGRDDE
jgi:hypothetical protein